MLQHRRFIEEDAHPNTRSLLNLAGPALLLLRINDERNAMSSVSSKFVPAMLILVGGVGLSGCATKSYVREQIAPVSQRVDTLEARLQETDGTAKAALAEAQAASGQLQASGQRLDQLNGRVDGVEQRLQAQESRPKRPRH
jgi:outer membrane murein-binding lipoprotein Lpp